MRFFYTGIFFAALMAASQAFAQSSLLQAGPVTPGHQPMYSGSGFSQPLVQDGGGSNGGGLGVNPSELGITSRSGNGANTPPYASNGNGPNGEHFCMFDAPTTNPTGYHYFCFDPNAQGGGLLDYGSAAGAGTLPLQMIVNGAKYQFPFVISGIVGPGTTTVGDIAIWNNAAGTLLKDISVLPAANGGLGAASLTGILVGAGTSAATAITPGSGVAAALANNADAPGGFSMFASTRAVNIWNYANGVNIGDCTHDAGPALQAAYNALGSNGRITIPALYPFSATVNSCYLILTPVVVGATQSHILLEGDTVLNANIYPTSTSGSTLKNGQTASPMITFTGASSANVESDADSGWGFEHLKFEGNNEGTACLAFPENTSGGRGAWTVAIHDTNFDQCAPAIDAANAWDWNISSNSFTRNGIAAGTGHQVATIYIFNSVNASSIFNSNSWRISNNFFDISKAQGIYSDSSGAGTVNQTMLISSSNHFGPKGYPSIAGCLSRSVIRNNVSEGSAAGYSTFNLAYSQGTTPNYCGLNNIGGNELESPGTYDIVDGGSQENIAGNTFGAAGSSGYHIQVVSPATYDRIIANTTADGNTNALVNDGGAGTTVAYNDGTDGAVANGEIQQKLAGVNFWNQLSTVTGMQTYTPTVSCQSGSATFGTATGRYKTTGPWVYVDITIPVTTTSSCASAVIASLPASLNPSHTTSLNGVESTGGATLGAVANNSVNTIYIHKYDGTYPGFSGANLNIKGWYEFR